MAPTERNSRPELGTAAAFQQAHWKFSSQHIDSLSQKGGLATLGMATAVVGEVIMVAGAATLQPKVAGVGALITLIGYGIKSMDDDRPSRWTDDEAGGNKKS